MLRTRIGLAPDTRLVSHAKARRLGLVTKLLSLLAVIGAVFLASSSTIAAADDTQEKVDKLAEKAEAIRLSDEKLESCNYDCHINNLKDVLTCGEISLTRYEKLWYVPWWIIDLSLETLAMEYANCELKASIARTECYLVCFDGRKQCQQLINNMHRTPPSIPTLILTPSPDEDET